MSPSPNPVPTPLFLAFFVSYITIVLTAVFYMHRYWTFSEGEDISENTKNEFLDLIDVELEADHIENLDDIKRCQAAVAEENDHPSFKTRDLKPLLQVYLKQKAESDESSEEKYEKILSILETLEEEEPFSSLPEKEQTIANNLRKGIEGEENQKASIRRLKELTNSLGAKYRTAIEGKERSERWNKIGAVASIGGIILALLSILGL